MRITEGYMLKEIAGNYVVIPIGQNIIEFKSMLHLNETGAFIWKQLESCVSYDCIIDALANEYEASPEERPILQKDLDEFINQMRSMNLLIEV